MNEMLRRVFRLGVIELGEDDTGYFVRYYNRTASGRHNLDAEGYLRWRKWMISRGAKTVAVL